MLTTLDTRGAATAATAHSCWAEVIFPPPVPSLSLPANVVRPDSVVCVCVRGIPFADARKAKQAALSSRFFLSRARLLLAPNPAQVFPRPQAPTANNAEVEGRRSTDLNLSSEVEETIDETLIGGAATNSQVSLKIARRVGWRTRTPGGGWCILPSEIDHPIGDSPNPIPHVCA